MKFNVAFSSSGARFAAHVGVLAYLQDNNIEIKNFSGTSGGAIVASWGANKLPARDLLKLTLQFGYPKFMIKPFFQLGSFLDHSTFLKTIGNYCKPQKNLWVVTFNVLKMQKEIWNGNHYNLSKVLTATTCIPVLFKPVMFSNGLHIDGIFARFCPDDLWDEGVTLSVQLKAKNKTKIRYPFDSFVHKIESATISFLENNQKKKSNLNQIIYIEPEVSRLAQLDLFAVSTEDHIELFKRGYESVKQAMNNYMEVPLLQG